LANLTLPGYVRVARYPGLEVVISTKTHHDRSRLTRTPERTYACEEPLNENSKWRLAESMTFTITLSVKPSPPP
jgi:hypothetical protein